MEETFYPKIERLQKGKAKILSSGKIVGDPGEWKVIWNNKYNHTSVQKEKQQLEITNKYGSLATNESCESSNNNNIATNGQGVIPNSDRQTVEKNEEINKEEQQVDIDDERVKTDNIKTPEHQPQFEGNMVETESQGQCSDIVVSKKVNMEEKREVTMQNQQYSQRDKQEQHQQQLCSDKKQAHADGQSSSDKHHSGSSEKNREQQHLEDLLPQQ